ncbi:MAG TPA: hypothetical protein VLA16_05165 [Ideonella sp.]|nr:hypothetical protein [Ideonella sp.]
MAKRLLFVHGTGVRQAGYEASLAVIRRQLAAHAPEVGVAECLWGETAGARLHHEGASIPTYGVSRGVGVSDDEAAQALWDLLLQDPSFELGLLATAPAEKKATPPNAVHPLAGLMANFQVLKGSAARPELLAALALDGHWLAALDAVEQSAGFKGAKASALAGQPPHRDALARAIVAGLAKASLEAGGPVPDAASRDALAQALQALLADDTRGVFKLVTAPFRGLAESIATWQIRRKRSSLTDASYPAAGDILLYQAHGDGIRQFIADQIEACAGDEVFVFAHSLGGIACFELLVQQRPAPVKGLITFGSQAPFFYEIGALKHLKTTEALPGHFPSWINFYDLNDPLSYVGEQLFTGRVSDYRIESGESFPASHSAYLHSRELWLQVAAFIAHA